MSKPIDWEAYRDLARASAKQLARSYPGIAADDIEQAILEGVLRREDTFKRMGYGTEALRSIFRKYGSEYANAERVAAYTFNDQYHYTVAEVRAMCSNALFDRDAFIESLDDIPEIVAHFDEIMCRVVDVQEAFNAASDADRNILRRRFLTDEVLTPAEAKAASRAVDRLALSINMGRSKRRGNHDGPGARKAMTNAAAQAATGFTDTRF